MRCGLALALEECTINRDRRGLVNVAAATPNTASGLNRSSNSDIAVGDNTTVLAYQAGSQGWSNPPTAASPANAIPLFQSKLAALNALHELSAFAPVTSVSYQSAGRLLILGSDARVAHAVEQLLAATDAEHSLSIAVLWLGTTPAPVFTDVDSNRIETVVGACVALSGYFGAFELQWQPVMGALQVAAFDLVLDLSSSAWFKMHQPPQGYFFVADDVADAANMADNAAMANALAELPGMIGEFEKPKFFAYKESLCAHSRSKKSGCNQCIEVCSTRAISSAGDKIKVDPHLCMGCGACATVCPSGAMTYQYPRVPDRGAQMRAMLNAYRLANTSDAVLPRPVLLIHNATDGRAALAGLAAGLPAHVLPLEAWHVASTGLDLLLGAIAYGAAGVAILSAGSEAPEYAIALRREMKLGDTILNQLGYAGTHFSWIRADEANTALSLGGAMAQTQPETVTKPATFHLGSDKRGTLEFVIEHLLKEAKLKPLEIPLPPNSLFGRVNVDVDKCTLCLACAGACPESALMDGADYPRLKFLERNCVQCGLCASTCPENAITLTPRLLLTEQRKREVVLNESAPFDCISCGKAMGTKLMIDTMLSKLTGHSMFAGDAQLNRLKMCADCRVVDMMSNKKEYSILTGKSAD